MDGTTRSMINGHETGRRLGIALAVAALPFIALAPALPSVMLFHDHDGGYHVHRLDQSDAQGAGHHRGHPHELLADSGAPRESLPEAPAPGPDDRDDGIVIDVSRIGIAQIPSSVPTRDVATHLPTMVVAMVMGQGWRNPPPAPPHKDGRAPPRRGAVAVLLTSHALLI